jgi:hypothetical protein
MKCFNVCVRQPEATSFSRMSRYIELLIKDAAWFGAGGNGDFVRTPFQSLCDVIENEGGQPWVAEEIRTELKTERGELVIEDYVRKEVTNLLNLLMFTLKASVKKHARTILFS